MSTPGAIRAGQGEVEVSLAYDQLSRGLDQAALKIKAFAAGVMKTGLAMLGAGTILAAPLIYGVRAFADYEQALANLRAQTNSTPAQLDLIKESVEALALTSAVRGFGLVTLLTTAWLYAKWTVLSLVGIALSVYSAALGALTTAAVIANTVMWALILPFKVLGFVMSVGAASTMVLYGAFIVLTSTMTALLWMKKIALAAVSLAMGGYTISALLAKVGTWLLNGAVTVLTAGINLLVGALVILAGVVLLMPFVMFGEVLLWVAIAAAQGAWAAFEFGDAWTFTVGHVLNAFNTLLADASVLFGQLVDVSRVAMGGITKAMQGGDYHLAPKRLDLLAKSRIGKPTGNGAGGYASGFGGFLQGPAGGERRGNQLVRARSASIAFAITTSTRQHRSPRASKRTSVVRSVRSLGCTLTCQRTNSGRSVSSPSEMP